MDRGVRWAIFSDQYRVWFPDVEHEWYEKDPDSVADSEFEHLLRDLRRSSGDMKKCGFIAIQGGSIPSTND